MLPGIPGDFPTILIDRFVSAVRDAVRDFIREDVPSLAKEQEDKLNADIKVVKVGGEFLGRPVVAVSDRRDSVTLLVRFVDIGVPRIESLKLRLARAAIEVGRWVNLTTSTKPPLAVLSIPTFAIEIAQKTDGYEITIGGGFDKLANFEQYRVGVRWKTPEVYFRGFLAEHDKRGFLIDVHARTQFAIPLSISGLGLSGAGILYGEHFAPELVPGSTESAVERMEKATAQEYVKWARDNDLERWTPVPENLRIYGVSATICDLLSSGGIFAIEEGGIAYIDYGPIIVHGGKLKVLKAGVAGIVTGAIDVRSKSFFGRGTIKMILIPWAPEAITLTGTAEINAALKDSDNTWVAIGGYAMESCRLKILSFLELWGGMRIDHQHAAVRGGARAEGEIKFFGTGAGYSLAIDMIALFGWNPFELGGDLRVSGHAWLKILGVKLGAGLSGMLRLQLPKPLEFRLDVEFRLNLPWPLRDKKFPATIFNFGDKNVEPAAAPIAIPPDYPLAYIHGTSGELGELTAEAKAVWPDVTFDLPFQRNASDLHSPRVIVNPPELAGIHDEGGITVVHKIDWLRIAKVDEQTGNEGILNDVSASWLLARNGAGTAATSRLAIPCNNPLGWLASFDYAEPETVAPVETFRLQTFGAGPAQSFPIDPSSGFAAIHVERLLVKSRQPLALVPVPWAADYGRLLTGAYSFGVQIVGSVPGDTNPLPVRIYQLRIIGSAATTPSLWLNSGGTIAGMAEVQQLDNGCAEWAVSITRDADAYREPLEITGREHVLRLAAIGYVIDSKADIIGGKRTVLQPGNYRLQVKGKSRASRGGSPAITNWNPISRDFEVVRPPLRPYLRFATFGDERIFGLAAPGWNPNPQGSGFGHYQDHLGLIRSRVSYLSTIYMELWISPRENSAPECVKVQVAQDGTLAGSRTTREWEDITSQPHAAEQELVLELPREEGLATVHVYFSVAGDGTDIDRAVPLDQWTYRVSAYANPTKHLKPEKEMLNWTFGPFGARPLAPSPIDPIPAGFDFRASPAARTQAGWPLPADIARLADIGDSKASLGYLKILEWAGAFSETGPAEENVLSQPVQPEICLLRDTAASPVGLILRTSEPCDWRRVEASVVIGDLAASHARFTTRLAPSSDGCACLFLLQADGVAMRVPSGELAIEIRFDFTTPGLARLTQKGQLDTTSESFRFRFIQPFGPTWLP